MSKYTEKRINEIKSMVINDIPNKINEGISVEYLNKYRTALNLTVIQALGGCEFSKPKKDGADINIRFTHQMPNDREKAEIAKLLNGFIVNYETDFLKDYESFNNDDMNIPVRVNDAMPVLNKINKKSIANYFFGNDGSSCISKMLIGPMDIFEITATMEKIRIHKRNVNICIGAGVASLIIGGIFTMGFVNDSKKDKVEEITDGSEVDRLDSMIDDGIDDEIPPVEFDSDEVPEVPTGDIA